MREAASVSLSSGCHREGLDDDVDGKHLIRRRRCYSRMNNELSLHCCELEPRPTISSILAIKTIVVGAGYVGGGGLKEEKKMPPYDRRRTDNFQEFLAFRLKRERRCVRGGFAAASWRYQTTHTHSFSRPRFFAPSKRSCCKPH